MTQEAPKVSQMNQNLLLVNFMSITLIGTVHKLSFIGEKASLYCLLLLITDL